MSGESSTPPGAVFLSYASQDAGAAKRICDALRAAGIEVWFDQSELRGGDAWDQSIRKQIKTCALFLPIISHTTHDRREGYFRLEWKLAIDRSHLMDAGMAFLLPIVIDDTRDDDERVPERFREVQWTRLPGGVTPAAFVERVQCLLSSDASQSSDWGRPAANVIGNAPPARRGIDWRTGALYGAIAVAAFLVLGYVGFERLNRSKPSGPGAASIAVLPLANESGDPNQQYFSDGLSEDLITALTQFRGLKVIGRTSSFQFRDSKEDGRSIGAKLGVARLLEGSVRRSGEMVRVSAELIDTTDGSTEWSERYDRPYKDLFELQDEITRAVVEALRARLAPGERFVADDRPPSGDLNAYSAVLQGRFYFSRHTASDDRRAIESFMRATQIDPHYAAAWSGLALALTDLGAGFLEAAPAQAAYAQARAAAERAVAIAPHLAATHIAQGVVLQAAFDRRGAEAEFRRAVELAPNDAEPRFYLAKQIAPLGQLAASIELIRRALASEPLRANWYNWLAMYLSAFNRQDEAAQTIRRAIELEPAAAAYHCTLAEIEIQRGNAEAALAAARQETDPSWRRIALALAQQISTDRVAADRALKTLIENDARSGAFQIAQVYALRNDAQATFDWLERAWSIRDPGVNALLFDPLILRFKADPRFAAFCRKVGLPAPGETAARAAATT
jgi:TolB-like protein/Flp pilus assembly protein TadD